MDDSRDIDLDARAVNVLCLPGSISPSNRWFRLYSVFTFSINTLLLLFSHLK